MDCLSANQIKEFVPYLNQYTIMDSQKLMLSIFPLPFNLSISPILALSFICFVTLLLLKGLDPQNNLHSIDKSVYRASVTGVTGV